MKNKFSNLVTGFINSSKSPTITKSKPKGSPADLSKFARSLGGLPVHVVDGVTDVVGNITDYLKVAQQEETKRTEICARRDVAIESIRAQRDNIAQMLTYTFKERAAVLQKQFDVLDQALATGDTAIVDSSLRSMVAVIQSSPFKSVQEMQQSLGNKDFVIRLE